MKIKKGDSVNTPRFLNVKIEEVFPSANAANEAGYIEPTYYEDDSYAVLGKLIGENRVVFAAAERQKIFNGKFLATAPCGLVAPTRYIALFTGPAVRDAQCYTGDDPDMPLEVDDGWSDVADAEIFIGIFGAVDDGPDMENALRADIADREGVLEDAIRLLKI